MRSIACALVLVGCGTLSEPTLENTARMSTNRMSTNALDPNLSPDTIDAIGNGNIAYLSAYPDVLYYVLLCALDESHSITANGTNYQGGFGFAPEYLIRAMTLNEKMWMWACLEAHSNALGIEVPISVRGEHPNLQNPSPLELQMFPFHEGAFFGNGFRANPNLPFPTDRYAADGEAIMRHQLGGWMTWRLCGRNAQQCKFTNVGWARQANPHSCESTQWDGGDIRCHNPVSSNPATSGTFGWPSITVYLQFVPLGLGGAGGGGGASGDGGNGCADGETRVFPTADEKESYCESKKTVCGGALPVLVEDEGEIVPICPEGGDDYTKHTGFSSFEDGRIQDGKLGEHDSLEK